LILDHLRNSLFRGTVPYVTIHKFRLPPVFRDESYMRYISRFVGLLPDPFCRSASAWSARSQLLPN